MNFLPFRIYLLNIDVLDLFKLIRQCQNDEMGFGYGNWLEAEFGSRRIGLDVSIFTRILLSKLSISFKVLETKLKVCYYITTPTSTDSWFL
jgi:hypothetical protein